MQQFHVMAAAAGGPAPARPAGGRAARRLAVLGAAGLAACPAAAQAQLLGQYLPTGIPGQTNWFTDAVLERPHTEYDPLGVRVGDFVVRPSLSQSFGYDSNILGSAAAIGSPLAETRGNLAAGSDWARNALGASLSFDHMEYLQHSVASFTNWSGGFGGSLDIGRDRLTLSYAHVTATTAAAEIGTLLVGQPVTTTFDSARASYETTFGRFTVEPALEVDVYRFARTAASAPGIATAITDETANDRNAFTGSLTTSYELAPGNTLVLAASDSTAGYTTTIPGLPTPNYNDFSLFGGIDYRAGLLFRYRAMLGYEQRSYVSTQLSGASGPLAEFDVIWTPTQLTTVTGQVSRNLQNAVAATGSDAYTYTNARLVVDHEYLRNVLLQGFAQFQNAGYQLRGETQRVVSAGASVTWLLNRELSVIGRYTYTQSTDNVTAGLDQTRSLAELSLDFHL